MSEEARLTRYKTILTDSNIVQLKRVSKCSYQKGLLHLNELDKVVWFVRNILQIDKESDEYVYMICLDTKNIAKSVFEISHGAVNGTVCNPREIYQKALLANAVNIILIHNHPSGDPTPSGSDVRSTKRIQEAGAIIGVRLLDHVIIGKIATASLLELGYIKNDLWRDNDIC